MKIAIAEWSASYDRSWLKGDLIAGITVAAVLIPSALAYAGIVEVGWHMAQPESCRCG